MISPDLIKKAIIAMLRADTALVAGLGGDPLRIKELEFQGQNFAYPNVRVDVQPQTPIGNGTDRIRLSTIHWTNRIYSEQPYSSEADQILGLVVTAQFNKQWVGTDNNGIPNFYLIRIDLASSDNAVRIADKLWVATAVFQCQVNPKTVP